MFTNDNTKNEEKILQELGFVRLFQKVWDHLGKTNF